MEPKTIDGFNRKLHTGDGRKSVEKNLDKQTGIDPERLDEQTGLGEIKEEMGKRAKKVL